MYSFLFSSKFKVHFGFLILFLVSCKSTQSSTPDVAPQEPKVDYIFLDKEAAQAKIVVDNKEGFFNKIQDLDMLLQLPTKVEGGSSTIKSSYIKHLKNGILDFSPADRLVLQQTMDSCYNMIYRTFPKLDLPTIELIKTAPTHYGPSVYYTRENTIVIPSNELEGAGIGNLQAVMLHEISHILFRYNEVQKTQAYGLIGFDKLDKTIKYPEALQKRILLNPDGLDTRFHIPLEHDGKTKKVVPIIISSKSKKSESINGFMNYIKFDLYGLEDKGDHYEVSINKDGYTTLSPGFMGPFFGKIKENTQYIIHPDEIIADNFMMLLIGERDGTIENFSDEGQKLLMDLKQVLSN